MHHNNFGNFYTREIYAIPIPTGFIPIPIPIPIMSRMAIPMGMGFPWGFPLPCTPLLVRSSDVQVQPIQLANNGTERRRDRSSSR